MNEIGVPGMDGVVSTVGRKAWCNRIEREQEDGDGLEQ